MLDPDHAGLAAKVPPSWLVDEYTKKNMLQGTAERGAILVNDVEMVLVRTDRVKHDDDEHPVHTPRASPTCGGPRCRRRKPVSRLTRHAYPPWPPPPLAPLSLPGLQGLVLGRLLHGKSASRVRSNK